MLEIAGGYWLDGPAAQLEISRHPDSLGRILLREWGLFDTRSRDWRVRVMQATMGEIFGCELVMFQQL